MSTWETRDKLEDHCKKHGDEVAAIRGVAGAFVTKDYAVSCKQTIEDALIIIEYECSKHRPKGKVHYSRKSRSYFDRHSLVTIEVPNRKLLKTHYPNGCEGSADCKNHAVLSQDVKLEMYRRRINNSIDGNNYRSVDVKKAPETWTLSPN
jgi:hypothetical protein